jgi:hypothetical protein
MQILIAIAVALSGALFWMTHYVKSHPPDTTEAGLLHLQRGLQLGKISSAALLVLYVLMYRFAPVNLGLVWPVILITLAGNALNLVSLIDCLRELNAEVLVAALLVLLCQVLWVLFGILALPDF